MNRTYIVTNAFETREFRTLGAIGEFLGTYAHQITRAINEGAPLKGYTIDYIEEDDLLYAERKKQEEKRKQRGPLLP